MLMMLMMLALMFVDDGDDVVLSGVIAFIVFDVDCKSVDRDGVITAYMIRQLVRVCVCVYCYC